MASTSWLSRCHSSVSGARAAAGMVRAISPLPASVVAAIAAQEQFWLAEAALQSTLIGQPLESRASGPIASKSTGGNDADH